MSAFRCSCCGVALEIEMPRCIACSVCAGVHGDRLEVMVLREVFAGRLAPYTAIARMACDDAQLTGLMMWKVENNVATPWVERAPRRWEVVCGRAMALGTKPAIVDVLGACLAPYIPGRATPDRLQALADEMTTALCFLDPNVVSIDIGTELDMIDPQHLKIIVNTKTAVEPGGIVLAPEVEIPAHVLASKPAQA